MKTSESSQVRVAQEFLPLCLLSRVNSLLTMRSIEFVLFKKERKKKNLIALKLRGRVRLLASNKALDEMKLKEMVAWDTWAGQWMDDWKEEQNQADEAAWGELLQWHEELQQRYEQRWQELVAGFPGSGHPVVIGSFQ